jgi:hypothetical protein
MLSPVLDGVIPGKSTFKQDFLKVLLSAKLVGIRTGKHRLAVRIYYFQPNQKKFLNKNIQSRAIDHLQVFKSH